MAMAISEPNPREIFLPSVMFESFRFLWNKYGKYPMGGFLDIKVRMIE
jgi:hypothetical protein